jgi:signal transduction histidine kinase
MSQAIRRAGSDRLALLAVDFWQSCRLVVNLLGSIWIVGVLASRRRDRCDGRCERGGRGWRWGLLARTTGLLDRVLGERISIETIRSGGLWPAYCDAAQLGATLLNLAVNARDAMPDGGELTLEVANAYLDDDYAAATPDVIPGPYVMAAVTGGDGFEPSVPRETTNL